MTRSTHIRLNELRSLLSYSWHEPEDVHDLLCVHHVNHGIDEDEGSCAAHAGADRQTAQNSSE